MELIPKQPKLFLSSTVHDLGPYREALFEALMKRGFDVQVSEKGTLGVKGSEHNYENCLENARNCDYMIAMIGSRFGGPVKKGSNESITLAEIREARLANKNVYVFVHRKVLDARQVYRKYMSEGHPFLAIPNLVDKVHILDIIDEFHWTENGTLALKRPKIF